MTAGKEQAGGGKGSWWPLGRKAREEVGENIPEIPHLEWEDIPRLISAAEKTILQVSNGLRLLRRKTVEYYPDETFSETVKNLDSSEIVRTEYNRDRTVRERQVFRETDPPPPGRVHPHHIEKHEEYGSEDGAEVRALINVYSSGKGTAYSMAGGYTGRSARLGDGSKVQMWYDDENRLFEVRYFDANGQYHRSDGPAHIKIDHDREGVRVYYYRHGQLHSTEHAAMQEFSNQKLAIQEYYLEGIKYAGPAEWYQEKLKYVK